jgi:DNA-binding Lrp family transcriptional regulator
VICDDIDRKLIDGWQRGFPLASRPFDVLAEATGTTAADVIDRIGRFSREGAISRLGAVVRPNTAGASTLVALAVPDETLDAVAAIVNAEPGVNHSYEREHAYNLWFVVTGATRAAVSEAIARIESKTGLSALDLPLARAFHIDLGFPIFDRTRAPHKEPCAAETRAVTAEEVALLLALENGLPLVETPYAALAGELGWIEQDVIGRLAALQSAHIVRRLGLVVRHRAFGFVQNAMVVWNVPDERLTGTGTLFAASPAVTLCYERPRRLPHWPYNLFTMIHGCDRAEVASEIAKLADASGGLPHDILFSRRCFRQTGARLSAA